jgi:hypothetical protein
MALQAAGIPMRPLVSLANEISGHGAETEKDREGSAQHR